jgi:hypothetical protein
MRPALSPCKLESRAKQNGTPGADRTRGLSVRSGPLCPTELRARTVIPKAYGIVEEHRDQPRAEQPLRPRPPGISPKELARHPDGVCCDPAGYGNAVKYFVLVVPTPPGSNVAGQRGHDHRHPEKVPTVAPARILQQPQKYVGILVRAFILEHFQFRWTFSLNESTARLVQAGRLERPTARLSVACSTI